MLDDRDEQIASIRSALNAAEVDRDMWKRKAEARGDIEVLKISANTLRKALEESENREGRLRSALNATEVDRDTWQRKAEALAETLRTGDCDGCSLVDREIRRADDCHGNQQRAERAEAALRVADEALKVAASRIGHDTTCPTCEDRNDTCSCGSCDALDDVSDARSTIAKALGGDK